MVEFIRAITPLSTSAEQALNKVIRSKTVDKGTTLIKEGEVCQRLYFVQRGTLRHYYDVDGDEVTGCFSIENNWLIVTGFFSQLPSRETIEALEKTHLLFVTRADLLTLYDIYPDIERFGRLLAERGIAQIEELFFLLYTPGTAIERYERFAAKYSRVLQQVPLHQIASFLRMNQSTLSRIRAKLV